MLNSSMTTPAHFEILTKQAGILASESTFATYDAALKELTKDPILSANENHPYFWGNFFEIVLCGGDGCSLTMPNTTASL